MLIKIKPCPQCGAEYDKVVAKVNNILMCEHIYRKEVPSKHQPYVLIDWEEEIHTWPYEKIEG